MFEKENIKKSMSPKSRESLIEMGRKLAATNPGAARDFFEKAGLSQNEIQAQMTDEESQKMDNETAGQEESQEKKEILRKMYEEQLEKARLSGDDFQIKACERALKELEE